MCYILLSIIPFLSYLITNVQAGNSLVHQRTTKDPAKIPPCMLKKFEELKTCYNSERSVHMRCYTTTAGKKENPILPLTVKYFGTKVQIVNIINSQYLPDPRQKLEMFKKIYEFLEEGRKLDTQTKLKINLNIRRGNVKSVIASLDSSPNRTLEVKCVFFDGTCYTYYF